MLVEVLHLGQRAIAACQQVVELLRDGTIESVKIGDCRRVPRVALDEYIERLRRVAGDARM